MLLHFTQRNKRTKRFSNLFVHFIVILNFQLNRCSLVNFVFFFFLLILLLFLRFTFFSYFKFYTQKSNYFVWTWLSVVCFGFYFQLKCYLSQFARNNKSDKMPFLQHANWRLDFFFLPRIQLCMCKYCLYFVANTICMIVVSICWVTLVKWHFGCMIQLFQNIMSF